VGGDAAVAATRLRRQPGTGLGLGRRLVRSSSLDEFLTSRPAGLDVVRLVLAFLVLVSHTWTLGGFGAEPESPLTPKFLTLGGFAVAGFFALSGLLVGRSALRRDTRTFARSRAVRILPAYWCALVVSAFGAGVLGWAHDHRSIRHYLSFDPTGPFAYVGRAALLPVEFSHGIHDVFASSTPYGRATATVDHGPVSWINGSLWTLPYEVRCYLVVGLVAVAARRFGSRRSICAAWALTAVLAIGFHWFAGETTFVVGPYVDAKLVELLFVFLTGTLVAVFADRIPLVGPWTIVALVVAVLAGLRSLFFAEHVSSALLVLLLPPIGALAAPLAAWLRGVDISYGLYLFAWPVQQLIAMYGWAGSAWASIAIATPITVALALMSWHWVEAPLLRRWRPR